MSHSYQIFRSGIWLILGLFGWHVPTLHSQVCIDTFPYIATFELDDGGWTTQSLNTSPTSWEWAQPIANPIINPASSGTGCWVTNNNPSLPPPNFEPYSYGTGERSVAVSPCFDFTNLQNPGIQMNIWWESETRVDGTIFQYSIDGGMTWVKLGDQGDPFNWYNDTSVTSLGGFSGWSGDTSVNMISPLRGSDGWVPTQRQLTFLAGQPNVRFRFLFASDLNPAPTSLMDGFAFDDVIVADHPVVDLGPDTTLCFAQAITLNACVPGGVAYAWNTNLLDTSCTLVASQQNIYVALVADSLGFFVTDTIEITVSNTFVNLGPQQIICPGDTVTLDAGNPGATYLWSPNGEVTNSIEVFATGEYKVAVSDSLGCIQEDSVQILIDPIPDVDLGADTTICAGSNIQLNAGSGPVNTTYDWSPISATTQTVLVAAPGEYIVNVNTPAGCSATDTIVIGVSLFPVVDLGPDGAVCDSVVLDAGNPGASYQWSPSVNDTNQTYTVTMPGTYWVDVVDTAGCSTSDTVILTIDTAPMVDIGPDTVICDSQPITLNAGNPGLDYFWSNGDTTQTTVISLAGTYQVRVTNAAGCIGRDTIEVLRSTLAIDLGVDRVICDGDSVTLNAGPAPDLYDWSTGNDTQTISVTQAGTYSVTVMDTLGCELSDEVVVTVQPSPQPSFTVSGDSLLFSVQNFSGQSSGTPVSWNWDFGDGSTGTGQNVTHAYVSIGEFDVCLTVGDGTCERTTCETISIGFTSIQDIPGLSFALYPNPTQGMSHMALDMPFTQPVQVSLQDLTGRVHWRQNWGATSRLETDIDLRALPVGLYFLSVQIGEVRFPVKLLRQ